MPFQTDYLVEFSTQQYIIKVDNNLPPKNKDMVFEIS